MKVVVVAHGYPPELVGGTESSVEAGVRALADEDVEVTVIAGSLRAAPSGCAASVEWSDAPASSNGARIRVAKILRGDLYFDHWHKSLAPGVTQKFRALLRETKPDLVHVHHWIRLSRDLVAAAARERIPSVVTLHDPWSTCLIAFRVRPDTKAPCDSALAANPCVACAAKIGPKTPWVATESAFMLLAERQRDLQRELELARAVFVPSASHRALLERFGALRADDARVELLAPRPPIASGDLGGAPLSRAAPAIERRLAIGVWGHLMPHKGQDLVLRAARELSARVPIELHFAGADADPEFAARLRADAAGLDVHFHGAYDGAKLARHPATHVHVVVIASRARESHSLVLDEARALGLPSIVAEHGALADRARDGGSLVFAPNDVRALTDALERLYLEPSTWRRLADESRALAPSPNSARDWVQRTLHVYRRAIGSGAPSIAPEEWFEARMRQESIDSWDRAIRARSTAEAQS